MTMLLLKGCFFKLRNDSQLNVPIETIIITATSKRQDLVQFSCGTVLPDGEVSSKPVAIQYWWGAGGSRQRSRLKKGNSSASNCLGASSAI